MSIVKTDTLEGLTSGRTVDNNLLARRIASAWCTITGTGTVSIRDSENITSLVDQGVGDYKVSFITPMANIDYAFSVTCENDGTGAGMIGTTDQQKVSDIRIQTLDETGAEKDNTQVCLIIIGGNS